MSKAHVERTPTSLEGPMVVANSNKSDSHNFEEKLAASSIGQGLREIEELGLDHHLLHLEQEMVPPWKREPCPECGRDYA